MEHAWLGQREFAAGFGTRESSAQRLDSGSIAVTSFARMSPLQRLAFDAMAFSISPRKLEDLRRFSHRAGRRRLSPHVTEAVTACNRGCHRM